MAELKTITATAGVGSVTEGTAATPSEATEAGLSDILPASAYETRCRVVSRDNPTAFAPVEDDHPLKAGDSPQAPAPTPAASRPLVTPPTLPAPTPQEDK